MANATALKWSPHWAIEGDVLSSGPDVRYELAGLDPRAIEALQDWSGGAPLELSVPLGNSQTELRDMLVGLGVLYPATSSTVSLSVTGDLPTGVITALSEQHAFLDGPADIELVVRTEAAWPTPAGDGVHLGVDLTHHHTLVLGPLVLPGSSSCLACLDQLVTRRWGTDVVPAEPSIRRWSNVTAELIMIQLDELRHGVSPLVNATMAWDLRRGTVDHESLLRTPECVGPCRAPRVDRLHLPWADR